MRKSFKKGELPEVGEECLWLSHKTGVFHHTRIIHIHEESVWLEGEGVVSLQVERFKPIKTPEEVERERVVELACNAVQSNKACEDLNINIDCSAMSRFTIEALYDAGLLHDRKVMPLSLKDYTIMCFKACQFDVTKSYETAVREGYIIGLDNE